MERAEDIFLPVAPGACREVEVAGCASLGPGEREDGVWGPGQGGAVRPFVDGHEVEGGDWLLTKGCAERIDSLLPLLPSCPVPPVTSDCSCQRPWPLLVQPNLRATE